MGTPFLGEIKLISWNFAPKGWALANGQLLPINQNQALFSLLGTMYGGNGSTTFALPDLRSRVPIHVGQGFTQGQAAGQEAVTITQQTMPQHLHQVVISKDNPTADAPDPSLILSTAALDLYRDSITNLVAMDPQTMTAVGGSQPHENRQPFTVVNMCIALQGVFPSRN